MDPDDGPAQYADAAVTNAFSERPRWTNIAKKYEMIMKRSGRLVAMTDEDVARWTRKPRSPSMELDATAHYPNNNFGSAQSQPDKEAQQM